MLAVGYQPEPGSAGPSWLTVLRHTKDSLWSLDLCRCESAVLRTHWVLVVMDQCARRIVGFGVHRRVVDGVGLCRMFTVPTVTGRILFVFVVLLHHRRRIVHFNVTEQRPPAPRSKSLRRFLMTRRPAGCCAIATRSTATPSASESLARVSDQRPTVT